MTMLQLAGRRQRLRFRLEKLLAELRSLASAVTDVATHFEHFVHLERPLTEREDRILRALLDYGGGAAARTTGAQKLYVVPRVGTISPWASKATDIAKICSLPVHRIERGRVFELNVRSVLTDADRQRIGPLLHDRMTETLLTAAPKEELLFAAHVPRAVRTVDVLAGGLAALERANVEFGLALSRDEIGYLAEQFAALKRNPTDVELMMFAQAELRALPAQDLQRGLAHRRRARAEEPVRDDPQHTSPLAGRRVVRLQGQRGGSRRRRGALVLARRPRRTSTRTHKSPRTSRSRSRRTTIRRRSRRTRARRPAPAARFATRARRGAAQSRRLGLCGFTVSHLEVPGWRQPWNARRR
jgi:phosphoribosylformylglycinamidine synthase